MSLHWWRHLTICEIVSCVGCKCSLVSEVDDYTTASNIWLRISNKEYCSTTLRILIKSIGPRKPWCKFKSSAASLAIKSDNYAEYLRRAITNLLSISYL